MTISDLSRQWCCQHGNAGISIMLMTAWLAEVGVEMAATVTSHGDHVGVEVQMMCEVSRLTSADQFVATLFRIESRWWDDDPEPDVAETLVCEHEFDVPLPAVFAAVDRWLVQGHRLMVVPASWQIGNTGPGTGLALLLEGRAVPARPISADRPSTC